MKKFAYEAYDYRFLFDALTKEQRESLEAVLNQYIGCVNNEMTREAVKQSIYMWAMQNNLEIDIKKIEYE